MPSSSLLKSNTKNMEWSRQVENEIRAHNHKQLRELLKEGSENKNDSYPVLDAVGNSSKTFLHVAVDSGNLVGADIILSVRPKLLYQKDTQNRTALQYADHLSKRRTEKLEAIRDNMEEDTTEEDTTEEDTTDPELKVIHDCLFYLKLCEARERVAIDKAVNDPDGSDEDARERVAGDDGSDEDEAQIDTEDLIISDSHKVAAQQDFIHGDRNVEIIDTSLLTARQQREMESKIRNDLKQFVSVNVRRDDKGSVLYIINFADTVRPHTEHGKRQGHHISAYSLMTESLATTLNGKELDKLGEPLLKHVKKYAPSNANKFEILLNKFDIYFETLKKAQRDFVALADKRELEFLKDLSKNVNLPPAYKIKLSRVLFLAKEKLNIASHKGIKNSIKARDYLERQYEIMRLISSAISFMNLEPDITYENDKRSTAHGEAAAKNNLKILQQVAESAATLFDYPQSLIEDRGVDSYRACIIKHLSLIKDAYPDVVIDEIFVSNFFTNFYKDRTNRYFTTTYHVKKIVEDVEKFEEHALKSYDQKYGRMCP